MKKIGLAVISSFLFSYAIHSKTFDNKDTNPQLYQTLVEKFNIPIYYGIPKSSTTRNVPDNYDNLVDGEDLFYLQHPDSTNATNPIGLRLLIVDRTLATDGPLAQSGFIKNGDVFVSFRTDWAHAGPYTQAQMGQTHAGLAFIDPADGVLKNIEHPLTKQFLFPNDIDNVDPSNIWKTQPMVHVFRPRFMTPQRSANFDKWAKMLRDKTIDAPQGESIFGYGPNALITFNMNYLAPKYVRGDRTFEWVQRLGKIILGDTSQPQLGVFCSEMAWTVLALSNCDPVADADAINGSDPASCISPPYIPPAMIGDYFSGGRTKQSVIGLGEGPLAVIDTMNLQDASKRQDLLDSVFDPATSQGSLSQGQQLMVKTVSDAFASVKDYYDAIYDDSSSDAYKNAMDLRRRFDMQPGDGDNGFRSGVNPNQPMYFVDDYSPSSFGLNALLPDDNDNRAFDYVGTLVFRDSLGI